MKKVSIKALKQYLNKESKEELIKEIAHLANKFLIINDYYKSKINLEEGSSEVLKKYKTRIRNEFFPPTRSKYLMNGLKYPNFNEIKKIIGDFKDISNSKTDIVDIMLYHLEVGIEFVSYVGVDYKYTMSMENFFEKALQYIQKNNLEEQFVKRCEDIVDSIDKDRWDSIDVMVDILCNYLDDFIDWEEVEETPKIIPITPHTNS